MVSPDTIGPLTPSPSTATSIQSSEISAQCLPDPGEPQAGLSSARATSQPQSQQLTRGLRPSRKLRPPQNRIRRWLGEPPKAPNSQQKLRLRSPRPPPTHNLTHWHGPQKQSLRKCLAKHLAQTVRHLGPRLGQLYWPHQHSRAARYESGSYCSFRKS